MAGPPVHLKDHLARGSGLRPATVSFEAMKQHALRACSVSVAASVGWALRGGREPRGRGPGQRFIERPTACAVGAADDRDAAHCGRVVDRAVQLGRAAELSLALPRANCTMTVREVSAVGAGSCVTGAGRRVRPGRRGFGRSTGWAFPARLSGRGGMPEVRSAQTGLAAEVELSQLRRVAAMPPDVGIGGTGAEQAARRCEGRMRTADERADRRGGAGSRSWRDPAPTSGRESSAASSDRLLVFPLTDRAALRR